MEDAKGDDGIDSLPNLQPLQMGEFFINFLTKIGPLVSIWDFIYNLMTIKDTRDTLTFLCISTYAIIYQEHVLMLIPFAPLGGIVLIFYNYYYEVKFKRPKYKIMKNMRLLQTIMQLSGEHIEDALTGFENYYFWKSKEKTLFACNFCLACFVLMLPLYVIPFRFVLVAGLWGLVSLSSPFCVAVFKALIQITLEYGIIFERYMPGIIAATHEKFEVDYIPRVLAIMRWIPFVWNYIPTEEDYFESVDRRASRRTNGFFGQERDRGKAMVKQMKSKRSLKSEDGFDVDDSIDCSKFEFV